MMSQYSFPILGSDDDLEQLRELMLETVRRRCPTRIASQSEDIVQKAMLKVIERQKKGEVSDVGNGYWIRAAHHALIDEIRLRRWTCEEGAEREEETWRSSAPDPERESQSFELGRVILDCLKTLVRPRKLAVTLHLRGHSAKEQAQLLGYPIKRVRNLTFRGMNDLKSCLKKKGIKSCN